MSEQAHITGDEIIGEIKGSTQHRNKLGPLAVKALMLLLVFVTGSAGGYFMGRQSVHEVMSSSERNTNVQGSETSLIGQINPPNGYKIPAVLGNIGAQLVATGAIDLEKFISLYKQQNQPLTNQQLDILTKDTTANIVMTPQNASFMLNFFWALGLTSENKILTEGPMASGGKSRVDSFASTGGWTIGTKPASDLFASTKIMALTDEQQAKLEEVSAGVYRPCCDNPAYFPDCNHGMAMLGLLELMASQNVSTDEMFLAAKNVNAYWYPQQTLEIATLFKTALKVDFTKADAKTFVSKQYSSRSGFQAVHQYLAQNGLLEQAPSSGGSCGVR